MKLAEFVRLTARVMALYLALLVTAHAQSGACDSRYVVGKWTGLVGGATGISQGFSIDLAFDNGTYAYTLGVGDLVWFTLKGTFKIDKNPAYSPSPYGIVQFDPCIITLTPDRRTVVHRTGNMSLLASLGILSDQERTYFIWKGQQAGLKLVFTQFPEPPSNHMQMMSLWPAEKRPRR